MRVTHTEVLSHDTPLRTNATVACHGNHAYLFGGLDGHGRAQTTVHSLCIAEVPNHSGGQTCSWRLMQTSGAAPVTAPDDGCCCWGDQLWLLHGSADMLSRFDFVSSSWAAVEQTGCAPNRRLPEAGLTGFSTAVVYDTYMLAFGAEQNENLTPSPGQLRTRHQLMLHAFEFATGVWSWVPTRGSPPFANCVALIRDEQRLVAIGHADHADEFVVATLDLTAHADGHLTWHTPTATGHAPARRAHSTWAWSSQGIPGQHLVVLRGTCCTPRKPGDATHRSEWWVLDVAACTWHKLAVAERRASAGGGRVTSKQPGPMAPRFADGMLYDAVRKAMILVGGSSMPGGVADVHTTDAVYLQLTASPVKAADAPIKQPHALPLVQQLSLVDPCTDLRPFCMNEFLSDVQLVVAGARFPAHRVVLAAASPRFRAMLSPNCSPAGQLHVVDIVDARPPVMRLMLRFMYGCMDSVALDENTLSLFASSDRYGLAPLREACASVLQRHMSPELVTGTVLLAEHHGHDALMQACVKFAGSSQVILQAVLAADGYLTLCAAEPKLAQRFVKASLARLMETVGVGMDTGNVTPM